MRFRLFTTAFLMCLCGAAQTILTRDQLVSFIRSSIQLKHPDKQVSVYVSKLKLSERLDDRTIEELQGYGAGPKTVEALKELRDASKSLAPPAPKPVVTPPPPIPPPSPAEQKKIIDETREIALSYTKGLPDFICTQVTRRYYDPAGLEFWRSEDVITARLSYFEQKEDYKLVMVNNRVTTQSYQSLEGATSRGEFGSMLREIFEKESHARFEWDHWATLRKRRAYVFAYRISQLNSKYTIDYQHQQQIVAGYHGLLYIDRDTNMALRITAEAEDIPPSFPIQQASTMLDYDFTKIGERDYLLPLRAVVRMRQGKLLTKNEVEFRLYRKFTAEATVTFETPEPLPESQIKEERPK